MKLIQTTVAFETAPNKTGMSPGTTIKYLNTQKLPNSFLPPGADLVKSGVVPRIHQTHRLSIAFNSMNNLAEFTERYQQLHRHSSFGTR